MKFLSAVWCDLLLANYEVDPRVLQPFVPARTSLDDFEGRHYVSLVAFRFEKTSVVGVPALLHRRFEEVNLRFYVKPERDPSLRAVTFIKEIVPSRIIPLVANNLFDENYVRLPMSHGMDEQSCWYAWGDPQSERFSGTIGSERSLPAPGSFSEFITEHYWGYAKGPKRTLEYEVTHPQWPCSEVLDHRIEVDFGRTYGEEFAFLDHATPANVLYTPGSEVTVSFPRRV